MSARYPWGTAVALLALGAVPARAQDSQFGLQGLGVPGRQESGRARATGGALAPFEPGSPLIEAALADLARLSASALGATSHRTAKFDDQEASLRSSRFPVLLVGGPIRGWTAALGYALYFEKSYRVLITDTMDLRGQPEAYTDELVSNGGIADLRVAFARRLGPRLAFGAGFHVMTGSTRETARRDFDNIEYAPTVQQAEIYYNGWGGSASVIADLTSALRVAAWFRSDSRLIAEDDPVETARYDLPLRVGGAVQWLPRQSARLAASFAWASWADAGPGAFDTYNWSVGAELGSRSRPFRLGVRGGTLPFGPGAEAPTELGGALGTGLLVAGGRGRLDLGLEYLRREGPGLTETVWTVMVGLGIQP